MISVSPRLFLASSSKTRKDLLMSHGLDLPICVSELDEEILKRENRDILDPADVAMLLAKAKGEAASKLNVEAFLIAADQVCEVDGEILDKPLTKENAILHLSKLRSRTHVQNCATVIYHNLECVWAFSGKAYLTMRDLTDSEINAYVNLEMPLNSAGSYMFEKHGKHLFSKVKGDQDVILGLPVVDLLCKLYDMKLISLV